MPDLPTGTVTLLCTALEVASPAAGHDPAASDGPAHLVRAAIERWRGHAFPANDGGLVAAFARAGDAVQAALAAQRALHAPFGSAGGAVGARMAVHTGEPMLEGGRYVGLDLHRVLQICAAAHPGQILLSATTQLLLSHDLPGEARLRDLGEHRLKGLERAERLYQLEVPDLPREFPRLRSLHAAPDLPTARGSFIGREGELTTLRELIARRETRLVTLTGPAGAGKTRLALHFAASAAGDFEDGVGFVTLAPLRDARRVVPTIARTLGLPDEEGQVALDALKAHLSSRSVLLLLDNFEQVIDAAPALVELLAACPRLSLLVTSRARLRVWGERELPVPPLALPERQPLPPLERLSQYAAVRLFIERAYAADPAFAVTSETAPIVAEICHRLDGLPLAIELAAARAGQLPLTQLLVQLGGPPAAAPAALEFLSGGAADLPARQRTLRDAIAWSYELLPPPEQTLFRRLAIFAGGCTLEAAELVCAGGDDPVDPHAAVTEPPPPLELDVLDGLASLVEKSLLRGLDDAPREPRFEMLGVIRDYALEQLVRSGELPALAWRHAAYFTDLVETAESAPGDAEAAAHLARLRAEGDNLRAALDWCLSPGGELPAAARAAGLEFGLRLGSALWPFWRSQLLLSEGERWVRAFLDEAATAPVSPPLLASGLFAAGKLAFARGRPAEAGPFLTESLERFQALGDARRIGEVLTWRAALAFYAGEYGAAAELAEAARAGLLALGNAPASATAVLYLGHSSLERGSFAEAAAHYRAALAAAGATGDYPGRAPDAAYSARLGLARTALLQGEVASARALLDEAAPLATRLDDPTLPPWGDWIAGQVATAEGDLETARDRLEGALARWRGAGDGLGVMMALTALGALHLAQQAWQPAAVCVAEALRRLRATGGRWLLAENVETLACLVDAVGEPAEAVRLIVRVEALREALRAPRPPVVEPRLRALLDLVALGTQTDAAGEAPAHGAVRNPLAAAPLRATDVLPAAQRLAARMLTRRF